jgi:hypothetical protein
MLHHLVEPIYGMATEIGVGFRDNVREPRLTGLAAFRQAKEKCIAKVQELSGPHFKIEVDRVKLERREGYHHLEGRYTYIVMTVFTKTEYVEIG